MREEYDVIILGGGLAGLSLARQLKRARPDTSILIAEKRKHPVPEAAHKVGEALAEVGAHYFDQVLGLKDHLVREQLPKFGLRFFFSAEDNSDIVRRTEVGPTGLPLVRTYMVDRGRLENRLARGNTELGVEFLDACTVKEISMGGVSHSARLVTPDREITVSGRWIVDAAGRACLLKRHLGLAEGVGHKANAAWLRVGRRITAGDWSSDRAWQARVPAPFRSFATVHLMGSGYWVWLIPLASGSTSVGIVTDSTLHPFSHINRLDKAMEWLREHEPQCFQAVQDQMHHLQDFHALQHYAHGCRQLLSAERWCITGDGGLFFDPLYSPGSDVIAIGNSFITTAILKDLAGLSVDEHITLYNRLLATLSDLFLPIYEGQYPLMGNARVMSAKVVWDTSIYWAATALLFLHGKYSDAHFMAPLQRCLEQFNQLNAEVQALFRQWNQVNSPEWHGGFVNLRAIPLIYTLKRGLVANLDEIALTSQIWRNLEMFQNLAMELRSKGPLGILGQDGKGAVIDQRPYLSADDGPFHPDALVNSFAQNEASMAPS